MMKKIYTILLCLTALSTAVAQPYKGEVVIECNSLEERGEMLHLDLDIHVSRKAMNTCQSWTIIPELVDGTVNGISFPSVLINGNNKRQIYERREKFETNWWIANQPYQMVNVNRDTDTTLRYVMDVPYEMWMDDAQLIVRQVLTSCRDQQQLFTVNVAKGVQLAAREPYAVTPLLALLVPERELVKTRNIQAQAYLDFQVGRSNIVPTFRRNPEELRKIENTLKGVQQDPDVTITGMFIEGYASPEGSYALNTRLSSERAGALVDYVANNFGIPKNIIRSSSVPEDWDGLRVLVELSSTLPFRDEVLRIIDSNVEPDVKERQLRAYPSAWRIMLNEYFPSLRRSDYRVDFTVKEYNVEEALDVLNRDPSMLSHYELYMLATSYPKGSADYDRIFDMISQMYGDDPTVNVNTGIILLERGEYTGARRRLEQAQDQAEALNALGVLYMLEGNLDRAEELLNRSSMLGSNEAKHNLEELRKKREDNAKFERYRNR